ncbi:MAG: glycosyltransferase family 2 protein [Desulfobacterales bacterium]|nr:MAG: glycosyltransferase family 2 protein [Desulfobacterales bacterium]
MKKIPISACIITYNEEGNIRECLESVKWTDEIVVVDSYSTDNTVEIAQEYTDNVTQISWPGHVAQKNNTLEYATNEWVLSLDADERISPELKEEIQAELQKSTLRWDGFFMPRLTFYLERWIRHGGWYPDLRLRLFKKSKSRWGGQDPHDKVILDGKAKKLKNPIYHYNYRDLSHQIATIESYSGIGSSELFKAGRAFRISDLLLRPPLRFLRDFFLKQGVRDGLPGLIIAVNTSFYVFTKYAKLWELHKKRSKGKP